MIEFSYVHIPFCRQKCKYCAFVSFVNLNSIEEYINSLLIEIEKKYDNGAQKTLYIGGGTPSLLNPNLIKKIVDKFNFTKDAEITLEGNPENLTLDYLKQILDVGVNRLSIGIQTFDDNILKLLNRRHSAKEALSSIENAKKAGFKNVSIDLMYGLLEQNIDLFKKDLTIANNLDIEHISTYGLKIEDNTYFGKFPPKNLPDEDMQAKMYELAICKLTNFKLYEISNFAKNEIYQSKHNLNYWNVEPYWGFGLNASGFDGKYRYQNTDIIKEYFKDPLKTKEKILMTKKDLLEENIFLGFRKEEGIDVEKIEKQFNINFNLKYEKIIEKYLKTGHILKTKKGYKLSLEGILISNYILCDFLC